MHPFVQRLLPVRANPIGVDFGTETLRIAQVERMNGEFRLVAAASAEIPSEIRDNNTARFTFLKDTVRDLLAQNRFHGRRSILSLPASRMSVQHLRLTPDDASRHGALHVSLHHHLKIDTSDVLLRHLVAGQTEENGQQFDEVIVMTAERSFIDDLLHAAALAKLDVIAMNVEPNALVDCFSHVYRRRGDAELTSMFVDIGSTATRVVAARGSHVFSARSLPIAGNSLNDAVASQLQTSRGGARLLRIQKQLQEAPGTEGRVERRQNASACPPPGAPDRQQEAVHRQIDQACDGPIDALVAALRQCRCQHEQTFPNRRIDRLIFVGGESRDRRLCHRIANALGLPGQVGDPLVRMGHISTIAAESGIDRREPQPGWAVAIGLSMGPAAEAAEQRVSKAS